MRQVAHALLTRPPLGQDSLGFLLPPFDLHVLSTPPAFILSQDQTLIIIVFSCQIFIWLFSGILFSKDLFSELFSAPFSGRPFGIFQGCITVRLSRCCCLIRFGVFVLHPLSSATAYLEYHKLFALSTTFLKLFQLFSTPFFLSDSGLSY